MMYRIFIVDAAQSTKSQHLKFLLTGESVGQICWQNLRINSHDLDIVDDTLISISYNPDVIQIYLLITD